MNKKITRKEQAIEMRMKIIKVSLDLFNRKAFNEVTINDIAKAANCSCGNIYNYFKSKEDILLHIVSPLDEIYEEFYKSLENDKKSIVLSAKDKLCIFHKNVIEASSKNNQFISAYTYVLLNSKPELLNIYKDRPYYMICHKLLESLTIEENINNLNYEQTIQQFTIIIRGTLLEWMINNKNFNLIDSIENTINIYLTGLISISKDN